MVILLDLVLSSKAETSGEPLEFFVKQITQLESIKDSICLLIDRYVSASVSKFIHKNLVLSTELIT